MDRYLVGRVLGEGGFGITYIGCDLRMKGEQSRIHFPDGLDGHISCERGSFWMESSMNLDSTDSYQEQRRLSVGI